MQIYRNCRKRGMSCRKYRIKYRHCRMSVIKLRQKLLNWKVKLILLSKDWKERRNY